MKNGFVPRTRKDLFERMRPLETPVCPFDNLPERGELALVAGELKATPRQVALAFLTRLPDTFAIPKASRVAHVRENAGAAKLKLTKEQVARLERAYPIRIRSELPVS